MSTATVGARGRAAAERLMTSTCTVRQRSTERTFDPATGSDTATPGVEVYTGKCRVRPAGRDSSEQQAGGGEVFAFDYLVSVPFSVTGIREGHRVTVTASPDPDLVGVEVEVQRVDRGDVTARRLSCQEVT